MQKWTALLALGLAMGCGGNGGTDAGAVDAGPSDAGPAAIDAGRPDGGAMDASVDAGPGDDGGVDAGDTDAGPPDGGPGADAGPPPAHRIFVTFDEYSANMAPMGGPHAICQTVATAAGLTGTWGAIISTSTVNARDLYNSTNVGEVRNMAGDLIAPDGDGLWDGLDNPIIYDQNGNALVRGQAVWSGTLPNGTGTGNYCSDWMSNSAALPDSVRGSPYDTTQWLNDDEGRCELTNSLYCIGNG